MKDHLPPSAPIRTYHFGTDVPVAEQRPEDEMAVFQDGIQWTDEQKDSIVSRRGSHLHVGDETIIGGKRVRIVGENSSYMEFIDVDDFYDTGDENDLGLPRAWIILLLGVTASSVVVVALYVAIAWGVSALLAALAQ